MGNSVYEKLFICSISSILELLTVATPVPLAFLIEHLHSGGGCHTAFLPAVSSEVPLAGRTFMRQVRPVRLPAFWKKEVW